MKQKSKLRHDALNAFASLEAQVELLKRSNDFELLSSHVREQIERLSQKVKELHTLLVKYTEVEKTDSTN